MEVDKGGRPKNSISKNKQFLLDRLQKMYGEDFHPIMAMAKNAVVLQKIADDHSENTFVSTNGEVDLDIINASVNVSTTAKAAIDAWDKVAAYTEPKIKSLELSGPGPNGEITLQAVEFIPVGVND